MVNVGSEIASPAVLEAQLVHRRMKTGKSKPLSILAAPTNPETTSLVECVIKTRGRLMTPPMEYLCEWLGSAFATCLGLETPRPHPVRISRTFVEALDESDKKQDLAESVGLVFGSEYVAGDYTQNIADTVLSGVQKKAAASVLAFDVFVHNPDRRPENPNLFANRRGFLVYDHEHAFSFSLGWLGAGDPETDPAGDIVDRHVFRHALGNSKAVFEPFRRALGELDDSAFRAIQNGVPDEWTLGSAQGKLQTIMDVLQARRDAVEQWLPRVEAMVTQ